MSVQIAPKPVEVVAPPVARPATSLSTKLVCGGIAGIIGTTCIFPIDMVKTRLQNQTSLPLDQRPYKGGIDCFSKILKTSGPAGLYRGLLANLIGVTPEKAIKLAVNDFAREKLAASAGTTPAKLPLKYEVVAGATAGFCQVIATNPMEMVKIQMQLAQGQSGVVETVKRLGFSGLYRHTGATLCRDVPFSFIFFPLSANMRNLFTDKDGKMGYAGILASGMGAGAIGAYLATPMDVVKTKLQAIPKPGTTVEQYEGMLDCYRKVLAKDGVAGLFKGGPQRMMIVAPLFGITLLVYEAQQAWAARQNKGF